jgi:hypothetical protein
MDDDAKNFFNSDLVPQVYLAYHPQVYPPVLPPGVPPNPNQLPPIIIPRSADQESVVTEPTEQRSAKDKSAATGPFEQRSANNETAQTLSTRAIENSLSGAWHFSMVSWGPYSAFDEDLPPGHQPSKNQYFQSWDDSYGNGQTIYILDQSVDLNNPVSLFLLLL